MLCIVVQSTVCMFDLENCLKNRRRQKLLLGFKSYRDCPIGFYVL